MEGAGPMPQLSAVLEKLQLFQTGSNVADQWLREAYRHPGAWTIGFELLCLPSHEYQFHGALLLYTKAREEWLDLAPTDRESLLGALIKHLVRLAAPAGAPRDLLESKPREGLPAPAGRPHWAGATSALDQLLPPSMSPFSLSSGPASPQNNLFGRPSPPSRSRSSPQLGSVWSRAAELAHQAQIGGGGVAAVNKLAQCVSVACALTSGGSTALLDSASVPLLSTQPELLLRVLEEIPSESQKARGGATRSGAGIQSELAAEVPAVLDLCARALRSPDGAVVGSSLRLVALRCAAAWTSAGLGIRAVTLAETHLLEPALAVLAAGEDEAALPVAADLISAALSQRRIREEALHEHVLAAVLRCLAECRPRFRALLGASPAHELLRAVATVCAQLTLTEVEVFFALQSEGVPLAQDMLGCLQHGDGTLVELASSFFVQLNDTPINQRHPDLGAPLYERVVEVVMGHAVLPAALFTGGDLDAAELAAQDVDAVTLFRRRDEAVGELLEASLPVVGAVRFFRFLRSGLEQAVLTSSAPLLEAVCFAACAVRPGVQDASRRGQPLREVAEVLNDLLGVVMLGPAEGEILAMRSAVAGAGGAASPSEAAAAAAAVAGAVAGAGADAGAGRSGRNLALEPLVASAASALVTQYAFWIGADSALTGRALLHLVVATRLVLPVGIPAPVLDVPGADALVTRPDAFASALDPRGTVLVGWSSTVSARAFAVTSRLFSPGADALTSLVHFSHSYLALPHLGDSLLVSAVPDGDAHLVVASLGRLATKLVPVPGVAAGDAQEGGSPTRQALSAMAASAAAELLVPLLSGVVAARSTTEATRRLGLVTAAVEAMRRETRPRPGLWREWARVRNLRGLAGGANRAGRSGSGGGSGVGGGGRGDDDSEHHRSDSTLVPSARDNAHPAAQVVSAHLLPLVAQIARAGPAGGPDGDARVVVGACAALECALWVVGGGESGLSREDLVEACAAGLTAAAVCHATGPAVRGIDLAATAALLLACGPDPTGLQPVFGEVLSRLWRRCGQPDESGTGEPGALLVNLVLRAGAMMVDLAGDQVPPDTLVGLLVESCHQVRSPGGAEEACELLVNAARCESPPIVALLGPGGREIVHSLLAALARTQPLSLSRNVATGLEALLRRWPQQASEWLAAAIMAPDSPCDAIAPEWREKVAQELASLAAMGPAGSTRFHAVAQELASASRGLWSG